MARKVIKNTIPGAAPKLTTGDKVFFFFVKAAVVVIAGMFLSILVMLTGGVIMWWFFQATHGLPGASIPFILVTAGVLWNKL